MVTTNRRRVICDNDYSGDPDGLVQLAHHLLCTSVDLRFVVGGQVADIDLRAGPETAIASVKAAARVAELSDREELPIFVGSNVGLESESEPRPSAAAEAIVAEAMRDDTDDPLFVACGGSLTNIASAWLMEPRIEDRVTLVWIGGEDYDDSHGPVTGGPRVEYNAGIDLLATRVVFNRSQISIWQVPQGTYRQVLVSCDELKQRVQPLGPLGRHLVQELEGFMEDLGKIGITGETYVLGDSPLVLLTALQSPFSPSPSSSTWETRDRQSMLETGHYGPRIDGPAIQVFTHLDTRLLFEDLVAKLGRHHERTS